MAEYDDFPDFPDAGPGHDGDGLNFETEDNKPLNPTPKGKYSLTGGENGTYVLEMAGERWLIGMDWSSVNEVQSKKAIIKKGKELGAQTAIQRDTDAAVQVAYGMPIAGLKSSGLHSLAAAIAEGTQQPWRAVYRVGENLWWYIAVRDGFAIIPGSDIVGDAETIEKVKRRDQHMPRWQNLLGDLGDLEELIETKSTRSPKIIRIDRSSKANYISLAILLGAGAVGYHLWQDHVAQQKRMAFIEHQRILEAARHRELINELQRPPSPLTKIPMPNDVARNCMAVMEKIPVSLYGWQLINESCGPQSVQVAWKRSPGATLAVTPRGVVGPKGDTIVNAESIGLPMKGPDNDASIELAVDDFRIVMQGANIHSSIVVTKPVQQVLTEKEINTGKIPPPPPPPQAKIKFIWPTVPTGVNWNIIPGFRIQNIQHDPKGWKITAIIYGKRPPIKIPDSLKEKIGIHSLKNGTMNSQKASIR